jgi:metallo-beta-lactamase family protein
MDVNIKFLGGAQTVTGSKYLLEVDHLKILVDSGLFQGKKELRLRNWYPLPVGAETLDYILITHGHIDHIGFLPRLIKEGFHGRILCTDATADLMKIMLLDAAKLQEEEAYFAFKRGYSKHSKPEPLFTEQDALAVMNFVEGYPLGQPIAFHQQCTACFHYAGHILGAASVELTLTGHSQTKKIVFSGDIGRHQDPIMHEPSPPNDADVLIVESTYGNRINPVEEVETHLARVINEAVDRGGAIIIPAFALGRTQTLIYYLHKLETEQKIPSLPIFIDSPMAIKVTNLYERHAPYHRIDVTNTGGNLISIFDAPNIHYCQTVESSKAINEITSPIIIISASGMSTGGRILHHLYHRLPRPEDTVLFVGYQAEGTRGRDLLEGARTIRMFGVDVPVHCQIREVGGLSAHADQSELLRWISAIRTRPKFTFITHGEPASAKALQAEITERFGWPTFVPYYLESFELFQGI